MSDESVTNLSKIEGKWFTEENLNWEGFTQSHQVEEVLFHEKSDYQDILVIKSKAFGNILILDGIIQCTERDEFTYQEMITHIPMNLHSHPQKVLVIGGGDGGVIREVLKYDSVKEVVLCEIDQVVIDVCKKHLPTMASSLMDPRVNLQVRDGVEFIRNHQAEFDVIITDAPDPEGAAQGLFQKSYYKELKAALKKDGVISSQGETPFLDLDLVQSLVSQCRDVFPRVGYAIGNTPTYISGLMGYLIASNNPDIDLSQPLRILDGADLTRMKLMCYNSDIHRSSFVLPNYIRMALQDVIDT